MYLNITGESDVEESSKSKTTEVSLCPPHLKSCGCDEFARSARCRGSFCSGVASSTRQSFSRQKRLAERSGNDPDAAKGHRFSPGQQSRLGCRKAGNRGNARSGDPGASSPQSRIGVLTGRPEGSDPHTKCADQSARRNGWQARRPYHYGRARTRHCGRRTELAPRRNSCRRGRCLLRDFGGTGTRSIGRGQCRSGKTRYRCCCQTRGSWQGFAGRRNQGTGSRSRCASRIGTGPERATQCSGTLGQFARGQPTAIYSRVGQRGRASGCPFARQRPAAPVHFANAAPYAAGG